MTNSTIIYNNLITDTTCQIVLTGFIILCYPCAMERKIPKYPSILHLAERLNKSVKTIGRNLKIFNIKGLIISRR